MRYPQNTPRFSRAAFGFRVQFLDLLHWVAVPDNFSQSQTLYIKTIGGSDLYKPHARWVFAMQRDTRIGIHQLPGEDRETLSRAFRRPIKYALETRFHDHLREDL